MARSTRARQRFQSIRPVLAGAFFHTEEEVNEPRTDALEETILERAQSDGLFAIAYGLLMLSNAQHRTALNIQELPMKIEIALDQIATALDHAIPRN